MSALIQEILEPDRRTYIGSSDAAPILGVSPWISPFQLYQKKVGAYLDEITPAKQKLFNRGHRWEPIVIEMLIDELEDQGHTIQVITRNNRYKDSEYSFLAAEIDLEIMLDGELVNAEMKTVHPFAAREWGEQGSDDIPMHYTAQILHGQMVTNKKKTIVAALIGADDLRIHLVNRDDEIIQIMRAKELEFWQRIQDRNPLEPETESDVKWLYGKDDGSVLEADDVIMNLVADLQRYKTDCRAMEDRTEIITTMIKKRMGEASVLVSHGQKIAVWKTSKKSIKIDWKEAFINLSDVISDRPGGKELVNEIFDTYTTTKPGARPFLLK